MDQPEHTPKQKITLQDCIDLYKETFYTDDEESIALTFAIVIGSKLKTPPVWLYLIGPSSGGKSTLIEAFSTVPFITQVSDLTANTFLSGAKSSTRETSLLKRLGLNFVITMKDFTTILTKPDETQSAIIGQMREIYDGEITKETGNGETVAWGVPIKGKATFIMAATEGIYTAQDKFADMGTRAINYVLKPQDRKLFTKRALKNNTKMVKEMAKIQELFAAYVMQQIEDMPGELPNLSDELEDEIVEVSNFTSMSRSVVNRDYRGVANLALSAEMPARMAKQMLSILQVITYMCDGEVPQKYIDAVFKTSFDSIIKQRRLVLEQLAIYNRVTRAGLSDLINYPPERCEEWLKDLHMFKIINRIRRKGGRQYWSINEEYRPLLIKYLKLEQAEGDLESDEEESGAGYYSGDDDSYEAREVRELEESAVQQDFEDL